MEKSEKVLWDKCFESMRMNIAQQRSENSMIFFKEYLIAKAAAYDRLMSGGKKHLKTVEYASKVVWQ